MPPYQKKTGGIPSLYQGRQVEWSCRLMSWLWILAGEKIDVDGGAAGHPRRKGWFEIW